MIAIIGIPITTYICYKFATSMLFDLTNESKAMFAHHMLGVITAQNVIAIVLIVTDIMLGFPKYLAILAVSVSFICTAIEVMCVKRILMNGVSLFESAEEFHKRLRK
tara:strand:- start:225 stop:545 length:321 start_codon:yes stop_codon:yes gene_type:complete